MSIVSALMSRKTHRQGYFKTLQASEYYILYITTCLRQEVSGNMGGGFVIRTDFCYIFYESLFPDTCLGQVALIAWKALMRQLEVFRQLSNYRDLV